MLARTEPQGMCPLVGALERVHSRFKDQKMEICITKSQLGETHKPKMFGIDWTISRRKE